MCGERRQRGVLSRQHSFPAPHSSRYQMTTIYKLNLTKHFLKLASFSVRRGRCRKSRKPFLPRRSFWRNIHRSLAQQVIVPPQLRPYAALSRRPPQSHISGRQISKLNFFVTEGSSLLSVWCPAEIMLTPFLQLFIKFHRAGFGKAGRWTLNPIWRHTPLQA